MSAADRTARLRAALPWAIAALGVAVLLVHASRYWAFHSDDTLISLRYAERLLAGDGLTWTDGERVEGYSNLLWILLVAGFGAIGIDLLEASRLLGVACLGLAIVIGVGAWADDRDDVPTALSVAAVAALGMALTGSFAIWAVGGLEQPLVALLLCAATARLVVLAERDGEVSFGALAWAGLGMGAIVLTRPDGPLFVGAAALAWALAGGLRRRALLGALVIVLPGVALFALQLGFRLAYYGDWVPNTAYAKVAFTSTRVAQGGAYWWGGVKALWPIAPFACLGFVTAMMNPARRARALLVGAPLIVWSLWVVAIGGDIFPGRRHLVVVVLLQALLAAEGLRFLCTRVNAPWRWAVPAVATAALCGLGVLQWRSDPTHLRALREIAWADRGESLGRLLGAGFEPQRPLLAVTAAGALPYFSKLPALDMLGLTDRHLARHPPEDLGRGRIGHELGDGAYVLGREPDLVVFCGTRGAEQACSRGGREMQADARFAEQYRLVHFIGDDPIPVRGLVWVRRTSPRIGIQRGAGSIRVPGYLFSDGEPGDVVLLPEAGLALRLGRKGEADLHALEIPPGRWRIEADATPGFVATLSETGSGSPIAHGPLPLEIEIRADAPRAHDLALSHPAAADATLREVRIGEIH